MKLIQINEFEKIVSQDIKSESRYVDPSGNGTDTTLAGAIGYLNLHLEYDDYGELLSVHSNGGSGERKPMAHWG